MKKHLIIISFISLILLSNGYAITGTQYIGVFLIKTSLQNASETKVSLSMNALLLKAEITENRLLAAMQANKIKTLSKARVNPQTKLLLTSYEKQLSDLYTFGYREIPKEIERNILARIQHKNEGYFLKDHTPNPFADIKAKTRYKTLSNGLFDEIHEAVDSIQYHHALLNTKTKKIIKLLPVETDNEYKVDPVVFALSVDPMADKYPSISPYAYCAWNPVMLVDPDGNRPVFYKILELRGQTKAGCSRAGSSWNYGGYTISPIYDVGNKNLIGYNAGRTGADGNFRTEYQMDAGDIGEFTKNIDSYSAAANLAYISGEPNMNYMMLGQNIAEGNVSGAIGNLTDAWESAGKDPGFWLSMATSIAGIGNEINKYNKQSIKSLGAATNNSSKVLQTGGHTLSNSTLKALGLTKQQGKIAIESLKKAERLPNNFHGKIMGNGDYLNSHSGKWIGNLFDYVH